MFNLTRSSKFGSLQPDIVHPCDHPCCDQLTAVKTVYRLTRIAWPYRGLSLLISFMACCTSIQGGGNSVFWLVTRAGLSCPIGISRFVPLRSRLLVTDNKTFIDQAWDQGGWILNLFYLYHKLSLISSGFIQRCITEKALLTLGQKSGTHYQTK